VCLSDFIFANDMALRDSSLNLICMKEQNRATLNRTVLDIGASYGLFANFIANLSTELENSSSIRVFAVEPIPHISAKIGERRNLKVIQAAIVAFEGMPSTGTKDFNIMKNTELSTFLQVNPNLDSNIWKDYISSLQVVEVMQVPCVTLKSLMVENRIAKVDFIKIDTQGTDLEVLLSASAEISNILSCALEFPYSTENAIYSNEKSLLEGIEILGGLGFVLMRVVPNGGGECNAFFRNSSITLEEYFQIEAELNFEKAPTLKIGRHNPLINMSKFEKSIYFAKSRAYVFLTKIRTRQKNLQ
jgi:FkbM family methyltransferase